MTAGGAAGAGGRGEWRSGVLVPSLVVAAALAILLALGVWQVERKSWKDALIASIAERVAAPPVALPPSADWPRLTEAD